jgi:hypothetical protein
MHRQRKPILLSVLAATLVSLVGRPLEAKPSKARDVIEVEILEYEAGSKKPTRERILTVPVSGKITGWADLFDEAGVCKLSSALRPRPEPGALPAKLGSSSSEEIITLDLHCATRPTNVTTLELEVERTFVRDEPTVLGVVDTQHGRRIEVIATRR